MASDVDFSLVTGDPLHRAQRAVGLIPRRGFGLGRRIALAIALTWLPLALYALWNKLLLPGVAPEPMLRHYGIHARFLVALPLFLVSEAIVDRVLHRIVPQFVRAGLVGDGQRSAFAAVLVDAARLRDSRWALAGIVALIALATASSYGQVDHLHELNWADVDHAPGLGFAAWWFLCVSQPLFLLVLFAWLWRLLVMTRTFWRIAALDLRLSPTHPDRAGGLGFVEGLPAALAPFVLGVAVVIAARWGHDAMYHGLQVDALKMPAGLLVVLSVLLGIAPLAPFSGALIRVKRGSLLAVGALLGEHGRLFERRWLLRQPIEDDAILGAPEIGPVADTMALYEAVARMRALPVSRTAIIPLAAAVVVPLVPVFATQLPLRDVLLSLARPLIGI